MIPLNDPGEEWKLIYTSPTTMQSSGGAVNLLYVDTLMGILAEYLIYADIHIIQPPGLRRDSTMRIRVNGDANINNYTAFEHIYGLSHGKPMHDVKSAANAQGLFLTRTHNMASSKVTIESKLYTSLINPKIRLETVKSNNILVNPGNWIKQDVSSLYLPAAQEINNLLFYASPSPAAKFYGIIKIYKKTPT